MQREEKNKETRNKSNNNKASVVGGLASTILPQNSTIQQKITASPIGKRPHPLSWFGRCIIVVSNVVIIVIMNSLD